MLHWNVELLAARRHRSSGKGNCGLLKRASFAYRYRLMWNMNFNHFFRYSFSIGMTTIKYQLARVQAVSIDSSHIIIFHEKVSNLSNFICVSAYMTNVIGQYFLGGWHWTVTEWEGEVLEIARISRLDMSAYLCIASNGVPPSVSKRIKVSVDCEYSTCWWLIWHHSKYI